MAIVLTREQEYGVREAKRWYTNKVSDIFKIIGSAGTGKTTLVYHIIESLGLSIDNVAFLTYVGKASLALSRKGTPARTIHSMIYDIVEVPRKDSNGGYIIDEDRGKLLFDIKFVKREALPPNIKLIVVDEAAMVPDNIANDIRSFGLPMIVLGDSNQLPPVFGESTLLDNPDVVLTEPMRQALDSPIIYLARRVIDGKFIKLGEYSDKVKVIDRKKVDDKDLITYDTVICGKNATREILNTHVRKDILGIRTDDPVVNDKIICRQNNWNLYVSNNIFLINGLVGYIENIYKETFDGRSICIDFRPEFLKYDRFSEIRIDYRYLIATQEKKKTMPRGFYNKFEYAYAITCHLAQGSEYEKVLIYNERIGTQEYYRKWLYTAITRSSDSLILAM